METQHSLADAPPLKVIAVEVADLDPDSPSVGFGEESAEAEAEVVEVGVGVGGPSVPATEGETDQEASDEEQWESESLYADALEGLGEGPLGEEDDACSPEEAVMYRRQLRALGADRFVAETITNHSITAKKLCTAFGIRNPAFLEGAPDEAYYPLLGLGLSRELSKRQKLSHYNTIDDAVDLLKKSKNIIVLTGAGISTSLGIPDFRSDGGLYSKLEHLGLSDPQEVFDIEIFREDPSIFYSIACDILPSTNDFSPTHAFIRLLQDKEKLLTNFTQNIDDIESKAGVQADKLVQCHGSFATATCIKCGYKVSGEEIYEDLKACKVAQCSRCLRGLLQTGDRGLKRKRSSNSVRSRKGKDDTFGDDEDDDDYTVPDAGVMKPDITFFGEALPETFHDRLVKHDRDLVDLVVVIGTSLKVAPVSEVIGFLPANIPQIYISRTPVSHVDFDVDMLGDCDVVVAELCRRAGWSLEHKMIPKDQSVQVRQEEGYESRFSFTVEAGMKFLVRFVQVHETFRRPEIQALAEVHGHHVEFDVYDETSPFSIITLQNCFEARRIVGRSVLSKAIYELWGSGTTYEELHNDVQRQASPPWRKYKNTSFRFDIDAYQGKRTAQEQRDLINSFRYLGFDGTIKLDHPEEKFRIFEDWDQRARQPKQLYLGRWVANGGRDAMSQYDLKKRDYISTTSMDSELALVTANLALARPGKLFYDPFVGTGSFAVACAHFGGFCLGSDIDGRTIRGSGGRNVLSNFKQYNLEHSWLDGFIADLTNSPTRERRWLDGILCDPPYGIREGLKVLGSRDAGKGKEAYYIDGQAAHLRSDYIPPKRPYSFTAMLDDILSYAANALVDDGRLCLWMPTANEDLTVLDIPQHRCLELTSICIQPFTKWSRRLLSYRRIPSSQMQEHERTVKHQRQADSGTANDLNIFRKKRDMASSATVPVTPRLAPLRIVNSNTDCGKDADIPQLELDNLGRPRSTEGTRRWDKPTAFSELPRPSSPPGSDSLPPSPLLPLTAAVMTPTPLRRSIPKDRFSALFSTLKTQTYHDPSSRGPGSHTIRTIAWNPTGHLIATGSADRTLRIWNPDKASVKNSTELRGHTGAIERVAWNPTKEAELASCSSDGTVRFWDVRSKACTGEVKAGGEGFTLAWKPDGTEVIVGRKDDALLPIHLPPLVPTITALPPILQTVQTNQTTFNHTGSHLLLTTGAGTVKILSYPSLTLQHTLHAHTSSCFALALAPTGRHLAIGGSDALVSLWDTTEWICRHALDRMTGPVRSVGFSFDGSYLAAGSDEGSGIEIAHADTGEYVHTLPTGGPAPHVAWHPHRYWIAYSGDPMGLKIVGAAGGSL
ncbi:MAG: NAD-dependent histone deacetylase sir2 [Piccolia ochrophora]|nr:MAG: NAD-dependent histone deacetylase sir2 [Piccolia ochrophora]